MNDWNRWNLGDTFANPEDYFRQCLAWMANERKLDINAIRANPNIVGYSLTGTQDQGLSGEGLTTLFRELKPGTLDALFDAWYPLRWCLFVEPVQVYRGRKARFEAVLANEDMLAARRLSRPHPGGRPAQRVRLRSNHHGSHSRSQGQAGAEIRHPGVFGRRGNRRTVGQVSFPGDLSKGCGGGRRRHRVLRGRSERDAKGRSGSRPLGR